jgi:hypothetical protein
LVIPKAAPVLTEVAGLQCLGSVAIRVASALPLTSEAFAIARAAVLPLPDAGALGLAGFVLNTPQRGFAFYCHQVAINP